MSHDPNQIQYIFELDNERIEFDLNISKDACPSTRPQQVADQAFPEWTQLKQDQCACCPLKAEDSPHCPAAVRVHHVMDTFKQHRSIERVTLTVVTAQRVYTQKCDLQSGLNSMLGLQMATSGCPVLSELRAMANFHTPLSTLAETLYRTISSYLTKQFFVHKDGGTPDWDLEKLHLYYQKLEGLNEAFSRRLKQIEKNDAISNSIVIFFSTSIIMADLIDSGLDDYRDYLTGASAELPNGLA